MNPTVVKEGIIRFDEVKPGPDGPHTRLALHLGDDA